MAKGKLVEVVGTGKFGIKEGEKKKVSPQLAKTLKAKGAVK